MKLFHRNKKAEPTPRTKNTLRQNVIFGALMISMALFVLGWWLVSIQRSYYTAFVECVPDNVASALENANNRQRGEEDAALLAPLQREFDSWRTRRLAEDLYTTGEDGAVLHGVYYDCGFDRTVIFFPGYGDTSGSDFLYAPFYESLGYNLLMVDTRANGESQGEHLTYGLLERGDAASWCNTVTELGAGRELVLQGYGVGSASILMAAGDGLLPENVTLIVAESVYNSLEDLARYEMKHWFGLPCFPFLNLIESRMEKKAGYVPSDVTVADWVGEITIPVLFLTAGEDTCLPPEDSQAVYEQCPTGEWLLTEEAQWGMSYPINREEIQNAIGRLCQ